MSDTYAGFLVMTLLAVCWMARSIYLEYQLDRAERRALGLLREVERLRTWLRGRDDSEAGSGRVRHP